MKKINSIEKLTKDDLISTVGGKWVYMKNGNGLEYNTKTHKYRANAGVVGTNIWRRLCNGGH
ncbi:hypothetical protein [Companilactobacillus mishanensis]|uniref:Bacteriocin n=1 Tax=Companilactobacillus mishanensis TaxID=2486008 RepID=A0A5P0ZJT2_9LACO|nr:hypothetical protein [Companilactobacillus mishanensis]MQS52927.1 hypothetical protein [Companilactobacillus mishanensis]